MSDPIYRTETTHIDEVTRKATSTVQWFLENRFVAGTHPITHNNKLTVFICGQDGFADIAQEIKRAQHSIDIICWGFDPGMELVRKGDTWPRGDCYGDLLIAAAKRHVDVRLLIWHAPSLVGPFNPHNMPGYTDGTSPWLTGSGSEFADQISAAHSRAMLENYCKHPYTFTQVLGAPVRTARQVMFPMRPEDIPVKAREEYCHSWYQAAMNGLLEGISVRFRQGNADDIKRSLGEAERDQPPEQCATGMELKGLVEAGCHHQKPVLIDFSHDHGSKAVGYVMGLNSLTDYWDSADHRLEDPQREQGAKRERDERLQGRENDGGFRTYLPYRDYACRIDGGGALIALYNNFVTAWDRAGGYDHAAAEACLHMDDDGGCHAAPANLLHRARPGESSVQILRTQPEENDRTIREIYAMATDKATMGAGYLYVENQYFQDEEWAQRLLSMRRKYVKGWRAGCAKIGKTMEHMPMMYVFIVIPVPERQQMVPRTYDTLATLGQDGGMTGQNEMIANTNSHPAHRYAVGDGPPVDLGPQAPGEVIAHANQIAKPDVMKLENEFGLKICTAMLNTCDLDGGRWRYRQIYIHSKLLLVDDLFFTLGSANLNKRSMAVDSELNLATLDPALATDLRMRIWDQLTGGSVKYGGTRGEMDDVFKKWTRLMLENIKKRNSSNSDAKYKKMTGFLMPFEDNRSSTLRLG